ncbi:hypothetical protein PG991_006554 [Apiospora marii]|uniref:Exonuclease domain-containing protein n=1 Tax=Apiospora marii TaxID=335849 RepID=A0ABR1S0Y0_9PEZI
MPGQRRSRSPSVDPDQSNKRQEVAIASPSRADHSPNSQPGSPSSSTFKYKGNEYTLFQPWELLSLDALIFTQKHSISQLQEANYFILNNSDPRMLGCRFKAEDFTVMPAYDPSQEKLRYVTIRCSHVECNGNSREVAHITVLNLINGEEIINSYVWPNSPVTQWDLDQWDQTMSKDVLVNASLEGGVLLGWEAVGRKLAQYVDAETIFVGYGLGYDLKALRISHKNVFDFLIALRNCPMSDEALKGTPYDQYPKPPLTQRTTLGAKGRSGYYERALAYRENAINCLKRPWGAYRIWS